MLRLLGLHRRHGDAPAWCSRPIQSSSPGAPSRLACCCAPWRRGRHLDTADGNISRPTGRDPGRVPQTCPGLRRARPPGLAVVGFFYRRPESWPECPSCARTKIRAHGGSPFGLPGAKNWVACGSPRCKCIGILGREPTDLSHQPAVIRHCPDASGRNARQARDTRDRPFATRGGTRPRSPAQAPRPPLTGRYP